MLHDERNAADGGRILELCQWTSLTRVCRHHCSSQHCLLFFVSLDHGRDPSTNMVIIDDGFDVLRSKYSVNIDLHISNHHIPTRTRTHTPHNSPHLSPCKPPPTKTYGGIAAFTQQWQLYRNQCQKRSGCTCLLLHTLLVCPWTNCSPHHCQTQTPQ